ncbi:MAG: hypothetical protein CMQ15_00775 [Gammaproteobacteria bacterium]|jgi:hypothetical protein|nr:hypothetical protein [Gammaproteobacteria bacterium]|tara:strand:- start:2283 stop:3056 length:774 start_codon:yes stop_codon:yes gene_type:complete
MEESKEYIAQHPHLPFLTGNNRSYMVVGYYPREALEKFLPRAISIPSDEVMAETYPTVKKVEGMHPFMLQFANCHNVHDLMSEYELRPYEEIQACFPATYTHKNGEQQHCMYVHLMYLEYLLGVIGGMYFGLRKQFRPTMRVEETDSSRSWMIPNVLDAGFKQTSTESKEELNPFFAQLFINPAVTFSYFCQYRFYKQRVHPKKVLDVSPDYEWRYKGSAIKNNENTFATYSEYHFSVSQVMKYDAYFHPTDLVGVE